ncbi:SAM-dependent methyltransferase [Clostridia bacterium]|nr:SAM-dependent methyltransferase [Clostridia bacterium]
MSGFLSDRWRDYELLDCSQGERLERWGTYTLVRPDPQIIWRSKRDNPAWRNPDARYERSGEGGGRWLPHKLPPKWELAYENPKFRVGPTNFKHMGIFPEQAANWDFVARHADGASILNLFAYTGAATISAAKAGAIVTHVDAAKGMVNWARENAALSGIANVRWIVDDCAAFIAREARRGKAYDAVILDPPSYGRGPTGQVWHLEDSLFELLSSLRAVLSDKPRFILLNTYTTGLGAGVLKQILELLFAGHADAAELGLPITSGGVLPCGTTGRLLFS